MAVFKASSALASDCATSVTIWTISFEIPCLRSASSSMRAAFLSAPKFAPIFPPMIAPNGPSRRPPSTAPPTAPPTDSSTFGTFFFLSPKPMASTRTGPRGGAGRTSLVAVVARAPEVTRRPVTNADVAVVSVDIVGCWLLGESAFVGRGSESGWPWGGRQWKHRRGEAGWGCRHTGISQQEVSLVLEPPAQKNLEF